MSLNVSKLEVFHVNFILISYFTDLFIPFFSSQGGAKLLYLNLSIRGYPKGILAGSNTSKPSVKVDDSFSMITYSGIPYPLVSVEVWGCGTSKSR